METSFAPEVNDDLQEGVHIFSLVPVVRRMSMLAVYIWGKYRWSLMRASNVLVDAIEEGFIEIPEHHLARISWQALWLMAGY